MNLRALKTIEEAGKVPTVANATGASRVLAEQNVACARECYDQTISSAQEGAKAFAEVVETVWGSWKLLHMRILQNMTAQTSTLFDAAHAITEANSIPEVVRLQSELWLQVFATTSEHTLEFLDLSARASQHMIETTLSAATRPMNGLS